MTYGHNGQNRIIRPPENRRKFRVIGDHYYFDSYHVHHEVCVPYTTAVVALHETGGVATVNGGL
jgi:hypothetical protein